MAAGAALWEHEPFRHWAQENWHSTADAFDGFLHDLGVCFPQRHRRGRRREEPMLSGTFGNGAARATDVGMGLVEFDDKGRPRRLRRRRDSGYGYDDRPIYEDDLSLPERATRAEAILDEADPRVLRKRKGGRRDPHDRLVVDDMGNPVFDSDGPNPNETFDVLLARSRASEDMQAHYEKEEQKIIDAEAGMAPSEEELKALSESDKSPAQPEKKSNDNNTDTTRQIEEGIRSGDDDAPITPVSYPKSARTSSENAHQFHDQQTGATAATSATPETPTTDLIDMLATPANPLVDPMTATTPPALPPLRSINSDPSDLDVEDTVDVLSDTTETLSADGDEGVTTPRSEDDFSNFSEIEHREVQAAEAGAQGVEAGGGSDRDDDVVSVASSWSAVSSSAAKGSEDGDPMGSRL